MRRVVWLLLTLAAAGCSGTGNEIEGKASGGEPAEAASLAEPAQCTVDGAADDEQRTVSTPEGDRTYLLATPDGSPKALLFDFHGTGGNAQGYAAYTQLATLGTERGYAVVTPQATGNPERWTVGTIPGPDDLSLFESLADDLSAELCGEDLPTFATGLSSGAGMSTQIACRSERAAAVAPVAGVNLHKLCPEGVPVSVLALHGTADSMVPYVGVPDWRERNEKSRGYFVGGDVIGSMEAFAERNGCASEPTTDTLSESADQLTWGDCTTGADVVLIRVEGGGHSLPGTLSSADKDPDHPRFPIDQTVDGRTLILDFFDQTLGESS